MSFINVSTVCQSLIGPGYNLCVNVTSKARSTLLPLQILVIAVPVALIIWKVIFCFSRCTNCKRNVVRPLEDPASQPLIIPIYERRIRKIETADNIISTIAITALSLPQAIALSVLMYYFKSKDCKLIVNAGEWLCEYTLNTIIHNL